MIKVNQIKFDLTCMYHRVGLVSHIINRYALGQVWDQAGVRFSLIHAKSDLLQSLCRLWNSPQRIFTVLKSYVQFGTKWLDLDLTSCSHISMHIRFAMVQLMWRWIESTTPGIIVLLCFSKVIKVLLYGGDDLIWCMSLLISQFRW